MQTKVNYPPLEQVSKPLLTTKEYCHYLNLQEQTAWIHSCRQSGPVRPVKVGRLLGWPTAKVKEICGVPA